MGTYTRGLPALVVGAAIMVSPLAGQENVGTGSFKWYFGAYAGATMFETTAQEDKVDPTIGAQIFVTARRTALRLSIEETFTNDNLAAYPDPTAPGGVQQVTFNNIRKLDAYGKHLPRGHTQRPCRRARGGSCPRERGFRFPYGRLADPHERRCRVRHVADHQRPR